MSVARILIVGGGIAGLTSAIAFRNKGVQVDLVELKPNWSVEGVGIIQQANVVRAMAQLGLVDKYLSASFGFNKVRMHDDQGRKLAELPYAPLAGSDYPPNLGVSRPALQAALQETAEGLGVRMRLGVTVESIDQSDGRAKVQLTDGSCETYDLVVGADGLYSKVRAMLWGEAFGPRPTGQSVWRHNFPLTDEIDSLQVYAGRAGAGGLVPISGGLMYLFVTSQEPEGAHYTPESLAPIMRERMSGFGGILGRLREQITDSQGVVYRPMEVVFVPAPWFKGRVVLIGDAAHATTPHLGQGAGMAIEDSVVLAEELTLPDDPQAGLERFMARRLERCRFICEASQQMGEWEMAHRQDVDRPGLVSRMIEVTSAPI